MSYAYSIGGPSISEDLKNGSVIECRDTFEFTLRNAISDDRVTGNYSQKNDTLISISNTDPSGIQHLSKITITNKVLNIVPIGPFICTERCSETY